MVTFLGTGPVPLPNPIDIRFQKVSGIGVDFEDDSEEVQRGSQNDQQQSLRGRPNHPTLVLERGLVVGISPLSIEVKAAIFGQEFNKHNVLVILMGVGGIPLTSYLFTDAYPIRWSITDLDADQNQIIIERLEMRYASFRNIGL